MVSTIRIKQIIKLNAACLSKIKREFKINKPAIVSKSDSITKAVKKLRILSRISGGESVLIKPNINSDDPYPGTSRLEGLRELIRMLKERGAKVSVGDMSSAFWSNTNVCAEAVGIKHVCEGEDVPLIFFDNSKWVKVPLPGTSLKSCWVSQELCRHKHLINLCVLKTHRLADFTLSLKNLMGCLHLRTRMKMHAHNLKQKIGEFQPAITPLLNIVDGTKSFIDGGPDKGDLFDSGVVLASNDRVALDVTGVKLLKSYGSKSLKSINPWTHPQIRYAVKAGIGVSTDEDIKVV